MLPSGSDVESPRANSEESAVLDIREQPLLIDTGAPDLCLFSVMEVAAEALILMVSPTLAAEDIPSPFIRLAYEKLIALKEGSTDEAMCDLDAAARIIQHAFASSRFRAVRRGKAVLGTDKAAVNCDITDEALLALVVRDETLLASRIEESLHPVTPIAAAMPTTANTTPIETQSPLEAPQKHPDRSNNSFSLGSVQGVEESLSASMGEMERLFLEAKCTAERQAEQDARLKFNEWVVKKTSLQEAIDESLRGYPEMHQKAHEIRLLFEKERDDVLDKLASSRREAGHGRNAPFGNQAKNSDDTFQFPYDLDDVDEGEAGDDKENRLFHPIAFDAQRVGQNKRKDDSAPQTSEYAYSLNKNIKPFSPPAKSARID